MERFLKLKKAQQLYLKLQEEAPAGESLDLFCKRALSALGVTYSYPQKMIDQLRLINGPLVFVANHPLGVIDALILVILMSEVRKDYRLVANSFLKTYQELKPHLFAVEIMDDARNPQQNAVILKQIVRYLKSSGTLGIFPAGEVSVKRNLFECQIKDREWSSHLGFILKNSQATVVPVLFLQKNSWLYQVLGYGFKKLKLLLLVREVLIFKKEVLFKIGQPFAFCEDSKNLSYVEITNQVRQRLENV